MNFGSRENNLLFCDGDLLATLRAQVEKLRPPADMGEHLETTAMAYPVMIFPMFIGLGEVL
jgi:hypothetical protein